MTVPLLSRSRSDLPDVCLSLAFAILSDALLGPVCGRRFECDSESPFNVYDSEAGDR